ncbi:hypothetical protein RHAL1_00770 [Beijerinckiaceae bacterium RH AL1]|jgi:hypothetical protein|nr:hypothetical protein [Beijerinckiaceae bacterium]VVB43513.1 hypothetical protein RHAL8_00738 [Beijerinckiaceae bacterium RH AL8]VVB43530.1 hypothetical protein RHCH11_RHCH11_00740 [Beijerinckiaceae bacterium RH CH11]VVC53879.1 hypothetical protein RHAL1_00770 [Beijerinckiaceae bacterium RH AL1]
MSIADHFEHAPDARFIRDFDSHVARRQFKISLTLVVVIILAATSLGLLVRFDNPGASASGVLATPPSYAGHL